MEFMYGWLAAPLVFVAGSRPAGHAPANAESSRTVSDPPFLAAALVVALVLLLLLLPHATNVNATPATQSATSGLTNSLRARTVTPLSALAGVIAHRGKMYKMSMFLGAEPQASRAYRRVRNGDAMAATPSCEAMPCRSSGPSRNVKDHYAFG